MDEQHIPEDWPQRLQEIARIASPEAALALAENFGGVPVYIPKAPDRNCKLVPYIGLSALQALAALHGGEYITIPRGPCIQSKKNDIVSLLNEGLSLRETAIQAKVSLRYVTKIASEMDIRQRQSFLPI